MNFKRIALTISLALMLAVLFPAANALAANVQPQCTNVRTNTVTFTFNRNWPTSAQLIIVRNPAATPAGSTPVPITRPTPQPVPQPAPQPVTQPAPQPTPQPVPQPAPQPAPQPVPVSQVHRLSESELLMINLVNQERQKAGVAPLKIDNELSRVARIKSEDMMTNGYFSHTSPTYGSPFQMMRTFGITFRSAGENIARSSGVTNAHNGLMNSEGHRRNILNPGFTHIGIGIAGGRYFTQMFISR